MALSAGSRLGPYEIVAAIGAGGMGEVYRATDTRLNRTVAIKVLPAHVASDPELRERFDREARTISSLNHPHICTLHDVGHHDTGSGQTIAYLVMEYLEGQTLADRLAKGALPADQALRYAIEIADALDQAHRHGIVHRDLKPGNIMITKTGAKLLDFGLAKLHVQTAGGGGGVTMMPTGAANVTAQGAILGTFQYMAPEQLEGTEADARTDIFAFGAVAYEMATGRKAFEGKSQASLISSIMGGDPPAMTTLQPLTPAGFERIVRKCLAKDPDERWQTARDLASELKWIAQSTTTATAGLTPASVAPVPVRSRAPERVWMGIAAASLAIAAAAVAYPFLKPEPPGIGVVRFSIPALEKIRSAGAPRVSPNGRLLTTVGVPPDGGASRLTIASIDSLMPSAIAGTEGSSFSSWSADSRYVGFFQGGKLRKVEVGTNSIQTLCDAPGPRGATWNRDGTIVFAPNTNGGLSRVSHAGGVAVPLTTLDAARRETAHRFPWFLPDGNHFLYLVVSADAERTGIYVTSLDDPKNAKFVVRTDYDAAYASGRLLFVRERTLMAQPFDLKRLQLTAEPTPLVEQVETTVATGRTGFSVSENGLLLAKTGAFTSQLAWVDRSGKQLEALGSPDVYRDAVLSPDGRRLIVERADQQTGKNDLWLRDLTRGTISRFTFDAADDSTAAWSPDGAQVIFYSERDPHGFYVKPVSGGGADELVLKTEAVGTEQWSATGVIVYEAANAKTSNDVFTFPVGKNPKPSPAVQTEFSEFHGQLSPNGKWLAYASAESGRVDVYVRSFPDAGTKAQISTAGGSQPRWRRDGRELFYISSALRLMAVSVKTDSPFEAGAPAELFQMRLSASPTSIRNSYDVTADGQRFLVVGLPDQSAGTLFATLNWTEALKR